MNLALRQGAHMVIVDSREVPSGLKVETPKGIPQPLHNSALGKALLLDLDEAASGLSLDISRRIGFTGDSTV